MINTYVNEQNPCVFCVDKPEDVRIEKKEEYLEITLCGNDTKLYVRESSVTDYKTQKTDSLKDELEDEPSKDTLIVDPIPVSTLSHKIIKSPQNENTEYKTAGKEIQNLYTKKWSGKTYFEEELRKIRHKEYTKEMDDSMKRRRIWKQFQKQIAGEKRRELMKSSGPEWWQEPSQKQICLATALADIIKADHEEGVTGRTRQWLLDLGVTTRLTPKQVRGCMKRCLLDPIDFLLEAHAMILRSKLSVQKKGGDPERSFSIDERILLSAMCVLQLPTLLTILHYILPPPKPLSDDKHILELLFGDLTDESIRYATPYMEPLPFRNNKHFQEWAFNNVFRSLLPSLWPSRMKYSATKRASKRTTRATVSSLKLSVILESKRFSERNVRPKDSVNSATPSVVRLVSLCVSKLKPTESLLPFIDEETDQKKGFSRRLTKKSYFQNKQKKESITRDTYTSSKHNVKEEPFQQDNNLYEAEVTHNQGSLAVKVPSSPQYEIQSLLEKESLEGVVFAAENQAPTFLEEINDNDTFTDEFQDINLQSECLQNEFYQQEKSVEKSQKLKKKGTNSAVSFEFVYEAENKKISNKPSNCTELRNLWDKIRALPEKNQLRSAIKVLADMGDPLAQLPRVDTLPTVQRWVELRRGKNRILSQITKNELLQSSRGMWKLSPVGCSSQGPKVKCSKREERLLTWDRKNWLQFEVKKEMKNYYTRIGQEKVDNSRYFFPSMLNHYDYGSKLNRNFRDTFFTYTPAREADTLIYRPWQPQETRNSKAM